MKTKATKQQVHEATKREQKLIAKLLATPEPLKQSLLLLLDETASSTAQGKFLQKVLAAVLAVSKEVKIPVLLDEKEGIEAIVEAFTQPEALKALAPNDPLAAARLKGVQVKRELLYGDGQPLTSEEVAQLLQITRQAVDKRRSKGQILGVSLGRRGYLYPIWQFQQEEVLPGVEQVLVALKDYDPWTQLMFFKTGDIRLEGATPLERLLAGDIDAVVWAAECYGEQGAA